MEKQQTWNTKHLLGNKNKISKIKVLKTLKYCEKGHKYFVMGRVILYTIKNYQNKNLLITEQTKFESKIMCKTWIIQKLWKVILFTTSDDDNIVSQNRQYFMFVYTLSYLLLYSILFVP